HRGGISSQEQLIELLELIQQYPDALKLSGLMGYDAHVAKLPKILKSPDKSYQQSQQMYQRYKTILQQQFPNLCHEKLCFNGSGSLQFMLHRKLIHYYILEFSSLLLMQRDVYLQHLKT